MSGSVLILTLPPYRGGVPAKAEILAKFLRERGRNVTIGHYATLTDDPDLVVPSWRMLRGISPRSRQTLCFGDFACVAIGCRFPELEFPYYLTTPRWRELIRSHDRHIAVGGTVLVANPLVTEGVPHMVWCASTMLEDRLDRRAVMPFSRRFADRLIVGPVQRQLEKKILAGNGRFMAVSAYTRDTLIAAGAQPESIERVPIPVDLESFRPVPSQSLAAQLGFAGRANDPRKNIRLLLEAVAILVGEGLPVRLKLTGEPSDGLNKTASELGISDRLEWLGWLKPGNLPAFYQSLDAFVFSSGQEGLGISGVQAMACGVPVISTRCGGPEDYVIDRETGRLAAHTPEDLARAIAWTVEDRRRRDELGVNARALVERAYGLAAFEDSIGSIWSKTWDETL